MLCLFFLCVFCFCFFSCDRGKKTCRTVFFFLVIAGVEKRVFGVFFSCDRGKKSVSSVFFFLPCFLSHGPNVG